MSLRKLTTNRGVFSSDEALVKLLCLLLRNIGKKWTDADPRLEGRLEPLYDLVRAATSSAVTQAAVTQNSANAPVARFAPVRDVADHPVRMTR